LTIELLHKHTLLAKTWAQLHKTVSKLGKPVSNKTLVKLSRRLYPKNILIHLL